MEINMGSGDRRIRLLLGVLVVVLGIIYSTWWGLLGVLLIILGVTGYCPMYSALHIDTLKKKAQSEKRPKKRKK